MTRRSAGLLLHPTSLPGRFGIGDLGPASERFLDWAESAGQRLWQILPTQATGGDSPYTAASAFAGNPLLLSPERLVDEGLLSGRALDDAALLSAARVDFGAVRRWKEGLLRESWARFCGAAPAPMQTDFESFRATAQNASWLAEWTLFSALKGKLAGAPWTAWPAELARRDPAALASARHELADEIGYHEYLQFLFFRQWARLKTEANRRGISIFGDVPIYVAPDSADVWAHRELFALDDSGRPQIVAGVPPDYFSETGQLWGYPIYRWDRMEQEGFGWWIERLRVALGLADLLRIDHFRGFASFWAVPAEASDARGGRWLPGPGEKLFRALAVLGELPVVAEDLGTITDDARRLLAALGIPGMKVLQFAFLEEDSPHAPHRHVTNAVVYTGTHDNDTARGWFAGLKPEERTRVRDYLGGDGGQIEWDLIRAAYGSVADRAIVPLQDVFGLGPEARMNTPAKAEGNWSWRARQEDFTEERAARLKRLAELTGR